jgi:hypothetical protein
MAAVKFQNIFEHATALTQVPENFDFRLRHERRSDE